MRSVLHPRMAKRAVRTALLLATLGTFTSCSDSTSSTDAAVAKVMLTFTNPTRASQVFTYDNHAGEPRNVRIALGSTTLDAAWLRSDNSLAAGVSPSGYVFKVEPGPGITFTPSPVGTYFGGSLTASSAVTDVPVVVSLTTASGATVFGPLTLSVSATP